jgi:hypothetical protein
MKKKILILLAVAFIHINANNLLLYNAPKQATTAA